MARAATLGPNDGSKLYLDRVLQLSKRKSGIQLPIGFVRSAWQPRSDASPSSASTAEPVVTPLVAMLRGGHGGEVRLKLYLSITLLAAHPPFDISRPIAGRSWATMLGLPDPEGNGARRIADALVWLDQHRYIALQRRPGMPPQKQSFASLIQPSDGSDPRQRFASALQHGIYGLATFFVRRRCHYSPRLVHHEINLLPRIKGTPIHGDAIPLQANWRLGITPHISVQPHPAGSNQFRSLRA